MSKVPGLMFADDIVGTTPSRNNLVRMADHQSKWAVDNKMTAGISECGVIVIGKDETTQLLEATPERWELSGQQVPIVKEYHYLGLDIQPRLSIPHMITSRLKTEENMVAAIHPF